MASFPCGGETNLPIYSWYTLDKFKCDQKVSFIFLCQTFDSNLWCCDTFLMTVSLLKNCQSEGGRSIHFWKALCNGFPKMPKSLPQVLQVKIYGGLSQESATTRVFASNVSPPTSFK